MKRTLAIILTMLLCLGLFCGCGAVSNEAADSVTGAVGQISPGAPMEAPESSMNYGSSYDTELDYTEDKSESSSAPTAAGSGFENAKLIYTADMELETTEFDAAAEALAKLVADMGGYFERSSVDNYGSYRTGYYTVRVPAESFNAFCEAAGSLCQLNSISRSATDISESYYDTEARLVTQQTKLARLQELLAKAENMEDIITIESAISETELMIENLTGTLRRYDSLVGFSTVSIYLQEVYVLTEVPEPVIGFGAKLVQAFKSGTASFSRNLQSALLSIARSWTGWLIFLVIAAAVLIIVLRLVKARRLRAAEAERIRREQHEKWEAEQKKKDK